MLEKKEKLWTRSRPYQWAWKNVNSEMVRCDIIWIWWFFFFAPRCIVWNFQLFIQPFNGIFFRSIQSKSLFSITSHFNLNERWHDDGKGRSISNAKEKKVIQFDQSSLSRMSFDVARLREKNLFSSSSALLLLSVIIFFCHACHFVLFDFIERFTFCRRYWKLESKSESSIRWPDSGPSRCCTW